MSDDGSLSDGSLSDGSLSKVGRTAFAVALARAIESERDDAWFVDPLARQVAPFVSVESMDKLSPGLVAWMAVRTRFLDELMLGAAGRGIRQFVTVGAGLDARAFRLALPADSTVFEVDRADVFTQKRALVLSAGLVPVGSRREIVADVLDPAWTAALEASGWQRGEPTLWLLEGFLIYFDERARTRLLTTLAESSAAGSELGSTVDARAGAKRHPLWHSFEGVDLGRWFAECGWEATLTTMRQASAGYGRPVPPGRGETPTLVAARLAPVVDHR